jgi:hypothetical protein
VGEKVTLWAVSADMDEQYHFFTLNEGEALNGQSPKASAHVVARMLVCHSIDEKNCD